MNITAVPHLILASGRASHVFWWKAMQELDLELETDWKSDGQHIVTNSPKLRYLCQTGCSFQGVHISQVRLKRIFQLVPSAAGEVAF